MCLGKVRGPHWLRIQNLDLPTISPGWGIPGLVQPVQNSSPGEKTSVQVSPRWQERHQKFPISTSSLMCPPSPEWWPAGRRKPRLQRREGWVWGEWEAARVSPGSQWVFLQPASNLLTHGAQSPCAPSKPSALSPHALLSAFCL